MKFFGRAASSALQPLSDEAPALEGAIDNQWGPVVRGWARVADSDEPALVVIHAEGELYYALASEPREDLRARGIHPTGECGFSMNLGRRLKAPAEVSVYANVGAITPSRPAFVNKPIFFMHIAKTAGSSVNEFFIDHFGHKSAAMHIEAEEDPVSLGKHQFISGHISLERFERDFDRSRYYTATIVREPVRQLVSHLNWVRHLSEPERAEFLSGHPKIVQEISARLQALEFSDSEAMTGFVESLRPAERPLFDNCQCRYFHSIPAAKAYDEAAFHQACLGLEQFDFVGLTEDFEPAMRFLSAKAGILKPWHEAPKVNVNKFDYGFDFANPELMAAIEPLVRFDKALYHKAQEISERLLHTGLETF
ncbi:hypothetical protein [Microbulbifer sp. JSM ZJ756]|uniref:hypothetical protein n=1 Tax=Microbulbifer sp. JSM ZJ756 TaxID=3376191 RepID=UPI0037AC1CFA